MAINFMSSPLFQHLKSNLKNARSTPPSYSSIALGFTKTQILTGRLNKPMLIWYDANTKTFFDQGDAKKIGKKNWLKVNADNFKKNKPLKDLDYYIPINQMMIAESDNPL